MQDYTELAQVPPEQRDETFWAQWFHGNINAHRMLHYDNYSFEVLVGGNK